MLGKGRAHSPGVTGQWLSTCAPSSPVGSPEFPGVLLHLLLGQPLQVLVGPNARVRGLEGQHQRPEQLPQGVQRVVQSLASE